MRAAILAVGTELTTGQISNGNAQWLSKKLWQLGLETSAHLTVADDRPQISAAMDYLSRKCEYLFITGGLGPTTDDFTREVIAEWAGKTLVFDEPTWDRMRQLLISRNLKIKESHKQECFFPEGAKILQNPVGTASAFSMEKAGLKIIALPGPPKEIEGIWVDHLQQLFTEATKNLNTGITESWDCMGMPESEIAELAEQALLGCPFSKAYRVHLPYVEFKLTYHKSDLEEAKQWVAKVDRALAPWVIVKNGLDPAQKFVHCLVQINLDCSLIDEVTGGHLMSRLHLASRELWQNQKLQFLTRFHDLESPIQLRLQKSSLLNTAQISLRLNAKTLFDKEVSAPEGWRNLPERQKQYWAEMSIVLALAELSRIAP